MYEQDKLNEPVILPTSSVGLKSGRPLADQTAASSLRKEQAMDKLPVIVTSNVKKTVKGDSMMNTSAEVIDVLNQKVHQALKQAMEKAKADGRKTVMGRDLQDITL